MHLLVIARLLDRRADCDAAIAARHQVDRRRAQNHIEPFRPLVFHHHHLPLARSNRNTRQLGRPCPAAVDHVFRGPCVGIRLDPDILRLRRDRFHRRVFQQCHSRSPDRTGQSPRQVSRVDTRLVQREKSQAARSKSRSQSGQLGSVEFAKTIRKLSRSLNRSRGSNGNMLAREPLHVCKKLRIESRAQLCQRPQRRRILGISHCQHAGCSPGRLRHRAPLFKDRHLQPGGREVERRGKPDNSSTRNAYLAVIHSSILWPDPFADSARANSARIRPAQFHLTRRSFIS